MKIKMSLVWLAVAWGNALFFMFGPHDTLSGTVTIISIATWSILSEMDK